MPPVLHSDGHCPDKKELEQRLKQAEEKLANSELTLSLLAQSANIGIWDWNLDSDSLATIESLHLPPSARAIALQKTGQSALDLVDPADRPTMQETLLAYLKGESKELIYEFKVAKLSPDQKDIWLRCHGAGEFDANGRVHRIVGVVQDITKERQDKHLLVHTASELDQKIIERTTALQREIQERERVERELLISEQRLFDIAASASDWFWETDKKHRFTFISERFFEISGYRPDDYLGKTRMEAASPEVVQAQPDRWVEHMETMKSQAAFSNFVYEIPQDHGQPTFISVSGKPYFSNDGEFLGYRGAGRDITTERRAQDLVERREQELQTIMDSSSVGVAISSIDDGSIIYANEHLARTFGRTLDQLYRSKARDFWGDMKERERFLEIFHRTGHVSAKAMKFQRPNGQRIWCSVAWHRIRYHGEPRVLSWIYDVDDLKRAEEKQNAINARLAHEVEERQAAQQALRQTNLELESRVEQRTRQLTLEKEQVELANRSKTEFLNNMSHELRTPLNAIMGMSEIMRDEILGPLENALYKEYANDIHGSGNFLLELINDILDVAKVEAGALQLEEEVCNLANEAESCLLMVKGRAHSNGVTLSQDLPETLPDLFVDRRRLKQILINLMTNAIKFTPKNGIVTLRAEETARKSLLIEVKDTGIGIAPDDLERVFHPFSRVEDSLTRRHEGAGLGLPIVKSLVEQHGGQLTITSELSVGTIVAAEFPEERLRHKKS
ncbi:PAS domain S-box protein [Rhodovibrionaceae bacterium A322]